MRTRVLHLDHADDWHAALDRCGERDVYFTPEYHGAYEAHGYGRAVAFLAEADGELLLHPFFVRRIEEVAGEAAESELYDLESVNGYSGPLATTGDRAFLDPAWDAFAEWCRAERIVAEFVRFNPLLGNVRYADPRAEVYVDREVVVLDLEGGEEAIWERYPSVQRNMVRKALRAGLVGERVSAEEGLPPFRGLYDAAMERLGASDSLRFGDAYFEALSAGLEDRLLVYLARAGSRVVAAALFLRDEDRLHYHLAASDPAERSGSNNLVVHEAARAGSALGCRRLHLGGGRTPDPHDALFRFKSSLSKLRCPFSLGRRVHDRAAYDELCRRWLERTGVGERQDYFFLYRLPNTGSSRASSERGL